MSFTSSDGLTDAACEQAAASSAPSLQPGWWLAELGTEGWRCGDWSVAPDGDRYLVWD